MKCLLCRIFGHGDKACPKKPITTKAWVPKMVEKDGVSNLKDDSKMEVLQKQGPEKGEQNAYKASEWER